MGDVLEISNEQTIVAGTINLAIQKTSSDDRRKEGNIDDGIVKESNCTTQHEKEKSLYVVNESSMVKNSLENSKGKSRKIVQKLGEPQSKKTKQLLGDDMTQIEIKKMIKGEQNEVNAARRKSISTTKEILKIKNPTEEQQKLDLKKHLSNKVIANIGDEKVRKQSAYVVEKRTMNPKVIEKFGEAHIAGRKPKQLLGDAMTQEEIKMLKLEEDKDLQMLRRKSLTSTKDVLKQKQPTVEQQKLELKKHLSKKVIDKVGDEIVRQQSQAVVEKPTSSAKAVKILGHSKVRGKKAYKLLGSPMTEQQLKNKKNRTLSLAQPYVGSVDVKDSKIVLDKNN